jgi:DNA-binding Lrp family transcriptional regulator
MLTKADRAILEELQDNFPIVSRPYAQVARKFNLTEIGLIKRIRSLKVRKVIRYAGAIFETKKLGIRSTLVAMSVPEKSLGRAIKVINSYPQVSHNYLREGEFNIWFTLSAPSKTQLSGLLAQISQKTGIAKIMSLETVKVFKINARFNLNKK